MVFYGFPVVLLWFSMGFNGLSLSLSLLLDLFGAAPRAAILHQPLQAPAAHQGGAGEAESWCSFGGKTKKHLETDWSNAFKRCFLNEEEKREERAGRSCRAGIVFEAHPVYIPLEKRRNEAHGHGF